MGLRGKIVSKISLKSERDVFQLFILPSEMPEISPDKMQSVELLAGHWGTVGSIICWNYIEGGVKKANKVVIESVDEKKKSISFKSIGGNMLESYNEFKTIVNVHCNGKDNQILTWTFEYEKKTEDVPDPQAFMDFLLEFSKQIEGTCKLVSN